MQPQVAAGSRLECKVRTCFLGPQTGDKVLTVLLKVRGWLPIMESDATNLTIAARAYQVGHSTERVSGELVIALYPG